MEKEATCSVCGSVLAHGELAGLCPGCLLGLGVDDLEADLPEMGESIAEKPGDMVGRYQLMEVIGEGGFGVVFRAEQQAPVRRIVAVKVIKPGMDSKEVVARFGAERQALALMDHANIAKVYDAGATTWGRPYFVMELVEGQPLTTFCDERELDIPARLQLFIRICRAVQHAHQKGVIHRDLKPSNIIVNEGEDGIPVPKIIDFGVAKAIGIELTEKTFFTMFGRMVGTPLYMSPEQAELNALDVDTRSDIYALGVVLYELVTGRAPLGEKSLSTVSFDEMRRLIREDVPPKPSARVMSLSEDKRQAAAKVRQIDPARFRRYLSGDLDWIVMKALEKDRNRRYDTVQGLSLDVRRYQEGMPVSAGPPGPAYLIGKFVRRHRGPVIVISLILLALIGSTVAIMKMNHIAADKKEFERLHSEVEGVPNRRKEEPGSRTKALETLRQVGRYPLEKIGVKGKAARELRDAARNELIACLAWTDLQERSLLTKELGDPWLPAALDTAHRQGALGFEDGRIDVFSTATEKTLCSRPGDGKAVSGPLRFSPDGELVAVGFGNPGEWRLVIWNWQENRDMVGNLQGCHGAFDFEPNGNGFVLGSPAGRLEFFDQAGQAKREPIAISGSPLALSFCPQGRSLAVSTAESGVVVIDVKSGKTTDRWGDLVGASLAWSVDGGSLAVGGTEGWVAVLKRGSAEPVFKTKEHLDHVDQVVWSPDGRLIATGSRDEIRLWDSRQGELLCKYTAWARSLGFSADGSSLGPVLSGPQTLSLLDLHQSDVCHRAEGHHKKIVAAVWLEGGAVLATAAEDGLRFWNCEGAELAHYPDVRVGPGGLATRPGSLYIAGRDGVSQWSVSITGGKLVCRPTGKPSDLSGIQQIQLSPAGDFLAAAHDSEVVLVDLAGGAEPQRLDAPASTAFLAISPDGAWLAAGTRKEKVVRVWKLKPNIEWVEDLPVHGGATVAFYTRGTTPLLMTGDEEDYRLWTIDPSSEKWVPAAAAHPSKMANSWGRMPQMVFSPRGTVVVVSYDRRLLQVLHPFTLEVMTQPGFDEQWPLGISPSGRFMATEAPNGRLFIWNLAEVRKGLGTCDLDWNQDLLPPFPPNTIPVVDP